MRIETSGRKKGHLIKFAVFGLIALGVLGTVVMLLWNYLIPGITGWHAVTYLQALGLLALCRILFGGFRGGHQWPPKRWILEKWVRMTPEERAKFKEDILSGHGPGAEHV